MSANNMDDMERSLADVLRDAGHLNYQYEMIDKTQKKVKESKRQIVETKLSTEDIEAYTKKAETLSVDIDALIDRVSRLQDTLAKIKFPDDKAAFGADKIKGFSSELKEEVDRLNKLKSGISKIDENTKPRIIKSTKSSLESSDSSTQRIRSKILRLNSDGALIDGRALSDSDLATTPGYDKALKSSANKLRSYDREAIELIKKLYTLIKIGENLTIDSGSTDTIQYFTDIKQKVADTSRALLEYKKLINSTQPKVGKLDVYSPKEKFSSEINKYIQEYERIQVRGAHLGDTRLTLDKLPDIIDPKKLNDLDRQALKIRDSIVGTAALFSTVSFNGDEKFRKNPAGMLEHFNRGLRIQAVLPKIGQDGAVVHTTQSELDELKELQENFNKGLIKLFQILSTKENLRVNGLPLEDIDTKKLYEDREKFGKMFSVYTGDFWEHSMLPGIEKDYLTPEASKKLAESEKAAAEKVAAEKAAAEKAAAEKAAADRLSELQKLKNDTIAAEKDAAEKAASEQIAENKKVEEATTAAAKDTTQVVAAETAKRVDDTKKIEEATVDNVKKAEDATTAAAKETTQALEAETSKRISDTKTLADALEAETKKANTSIVADTKNTTDQNAATYRAMKKQQEADATVLARSLNRIQNEESKIRIENLKQQNSLARIDAKSTADKSLEAQRQTGKLEVENAKAVAKEKELAAKDAAREKAAADKAASEAVKQQNKIELENIKQQHRLELEHEKATLREERDEKIRTEREKVNAARQSSREELEEARRVAREKHELERDLEKAKRDTKKVLAQEQKEQEKREKQAAKDKEKLEKQAAKEKEKAEKEAAKAAAEAEKDATKKAEEAARTKKEAWQIVGSAIKKVADIVKNSLSKALSLVKKDIQITVSLVKKGVDLFKSAGNTILRVLNLFGNFGDRLRSLFSGGIIKGVINGFNGLLNTVTDIPNKILDNRFVQVGESLLSSIQSLNIIIGDDLTNSTIGWAKELERGFGLSADGLISDMRTVAGVMKGLGMDGGDTATASKNLTIMSRSFSVMLGYKPEEAMSKIESGMKGMTQSVDDLGISVREAEMNSFLKELKARGGEFAGISTSFQNLNEEQRVYVRYASIIDQYLKAFSIEKYAKSLDTITGRLSILRERTRAFMSAVGNLFLQLFNKIVVPLTYAIDAITQKIIALASFLGLSSELSANMNGMTDDVSTTIDTSGSVKELGKEAKALDDVSKAAKEAKGGMDSFDHITSMHSSSSSGSSKSGDGTEGSDFDYSKLMDLNADDLAKRMEEMSKTMEDHTNSYKNKVKDGLAKIRKVIDTWYKGQTGSKIDWNKIFNLADFKKATEGMGKNIARAGKAIKDTFGVLLIKFAQDININRVLSKSLGLINDALGALADILDFLKPILIELYDEIISPIVKDLGDKVATSLDGVRAKLVQFREDLASGKYSNFKIVLKTLITGETSTDDMGALRTGDEENGTSLSRLNTAAEKLHGFFESILELIKQIGDVIVDLFKEMFNGEHRTIIDVIISAIHKISNFIRENKDTIIEILAALLELQATVIDAVINAILGIAKWLVEHKDTVVSILNKLKEIVDWLGKHIGVVIGFYVAIKSLSIISSAIIWISTFVKAIGTIKAALAGASAASTAASAAGGAASAAGGAASVAGGAGAAGAVKAGLGTKLLLNPYTWGIALTKVSSLEYNRENNKSTNDYLKEHGELGQATIDLAKANGSGYIIGDDGFPITIKDTSGFFGIFKSMGAQMQGGYGLQSEDIDNTLDKVVPKYLKIFKESGYTSASEVTQYYDKIVEGFIKENQHLVDTKDISQEQLDAAARYFRLALEKNMDEAFKSDNTIENAINDIADSMDNAANKFNTLDDVLNGPAFDPNNTQNKTSVSLDDLIRDSVDVEPIHIGRIIDDSIQKATNIAADVNKQVADAVSIIRKESEDTHSKISNELINSMQTMNSGTEEVKNSFSAVELGLNTASGAVDSFIATAISGVDGLRANVGELSNNVQLLNNDTSSALSVVQSIISSASSALSSAVSGVMRTVGGAVGIPSVRSVFGFANGGAPKSGQMFIAREDGMPELVGNFGGYSGVANNDMIVRAMHDAIYDGMMAAGAGYTAYGGNGGTVNFNNYGYFGGDRASFRQFAEMINNANKSSDSNIANRSFRS